MGSSAQWGLLHRVKRPVNYSELCSLGIWLVGDVMMLFLYLSAYSVIISNFEFMTVCVIFIPLMSGQA